MESMRARRPPAPIANRTIVLYGERHSGTNLLYSVLKKCFHIQTEYSGLYGFKHWWLGQENSSREALVPAAWAHNDGRPPRRRDTHLSAASTRPRPRPRRRRDYVLVRGVDATRGRPRTRTCLLPRRRAHRSR